MSNLSATAVSLLDALRHLGRADEAEAERGRLSAAGWDRVCNDDVARLVSLVSQGARLPIAQTEQREEVSPTAAREAVGWALPRWAHALRVYEPFVYSVDDVSPAGSLQLISCTARLVNAMTFADILASTRELFVDALGYQDELVEETKRLATQTSLGRIVRICKHDGYVVLAVENRYLGPHATNYAPVFSLHPHALIISFNAISKRLRIVYKSGAAKEAPRYRTLAGARMGRHPQDNLLVDARRLSALRPRLEDVTSSLERRAFQTLDALPEEIATRWMSTKLIGETIDGLGWSGGSFLGAKEFVQLGVQADDRLPTGLAFVLRSRFPMAVAGGEASLQLRSWSILNPEIFEASRWDLISRRTTRALEIEVVLACVSKDGVLLSSDFSVVWELLVPDADGEIVVEGTPFSICFDLKPRSTADDFFEFDHEEDLIDGAESELESVVADEMTAPDPVKAAPPSNGDDAEAEQRDATASAADLHSLWTILVEEKLAAAAAKLWRTNKPPTGPGDVTAALRRLRGRSVRLNLLSLSGLRCHLIRNADVDNTKPTSLRNRGPMPPAWACLESSPELEVEQWQPIAGARPHPAGGVSVPIATDDGWRLGCVNTSAHAAQPRWNTYREAESHPCWWVAVPLREVAHLPKGSLRVASSAQQIVVAKALAVLSDVLDVRVTHSFMERLRPTPRMRTVVIDIPNPYIGRRAAAVPVLMCSFGQLATPGMAWLSIPDVLWGDAVPSKTHHLDRVHRALTLIQTQHRDTGARTRLMQLGPEHAGIVVSTSLVEIPGPLGAPGGWRATIRTGHVSGGWCVQLSDGRLAYPQVTAREDMPHDSTGAPIEIVIDDPLATAAAMAAQSEQLFDGRTGDVCSASTIRDVCLLELNQDEPDCGPDAWLRFRLRDGEGLPSGSTAPAMRTRDRLWLTSARPDAAEACSIVEREWSSGAPPYLAWLQQLLPGCGLDPLPAGPSEWRSSVRGRPVSAWEYDPTIRHRAEANALQAFEWRCTCAQLAGQERAMERCAACSSRVLQHPRSFEDAPRATIRLPLTILHPWWRAASAAALGLTDSELQELCELHSNAVPSLVDLALGQPFAHAERRLRGPIESTTQDALERGLVALHDVLARHALQSPTPPVTARSLSLIIDDVPVVHGLGQLVGSLPGAATMQAPKLLLAYRRIKLAVESAARLKNVGSPLLSSLGWQLLQSAVDDLFGTEVLDAAPADGTLRSHLERAWPTTRDPNLRHTVPGQLRMNGAKRVPDATLRVFATADEASLWRRFESSLDTQTDDELVFTSSLDFPGPRGRPLIGRTDVVTRSRNAEQHVVRTSRKPAPTRNLLICGGGARELERPERPIDVSQQGDWHERWAFTRLVNDHMLSIAALADAATCIQFAETQWSEWSWPVGVPRTLLGRVVLREIWRELARERARPSALLGVLSSTRNRALSDEPAAATRDVEKRLAPALPSSSPGARMAQTCLAAVLCGWSETRDPRLLRWSARSVTESVSGRTLPTADADCWRSLPIWMALRAPMHWALRGYPGDLESHVLRAFLRLESEAVPAQWWDENESSAAGRRELSAPLALELPQVPVEVRGPATTENPFDSDNSQGVQVFVGSVMEWLADRNPTRGPQ